MALINGTGNLLIIEYRAVIIINYGFLYQQKRYIALGFSCHTASIVDARYLYLNIYSLNILLNLIFNMKRKKNLNFFIIIVYIYQQG